MRDPVLRVRVLDVASAVLAAAVTAVVLLASGFLGLLVLPVALGVAGGAASRPGRRRWVGAGVLAGVLPVVLLIVANDG